MRTIKWVWMVLAIFFFPFWAAGAAAESGENKGEIAQKNEVIYANLESDGALENVYVVNAFELTKTGIIEDYGRYESVKNLTDTSEIEQDTNLIRMGAASETFYYQGNIDKELPWDFSIAYYLDGEKVDPATIIGQSGNIEMKIKIEKNEESEEVFFENYMLQISQQLNTDYFYDIEAEDATIANAGRNKQVSFTVMPGEERSFTITAETTQFELEGMEIAALPSSISVDGPDTDGLTAEFQSLTDAIGEVNQGVRELEDGMTALSGGLIELRDGSSQYYDGLNELNQSSGTLTSASSQINDAFGNIQEEVDQVTGINGMEQLGEAIDAAAEMAAGLEELADGLEEMGDSYGTAGETLQEAMNQIPEATLTEEDFNALYESGADQEVVGELAETYKAAQQVLTVYQGAAEAFDAVEPALSSFQESARGAASYMRELSDGLEESVGQIDVDAGLEELISGVNEMAESYQQFHEGLIAYTDGVNELSESYTGIDEGIGEASEGAGQLAEGAGELSSGTSRLHEATQDIPEDMQKEIDEMISQYDKSDYDPISFVSEENNEWTKSVQFVIQTDSMKPKDHTEKAEEEEDDEGFFERLTDLFR